MAAKHLTANCIFCKIIRQEIPSFKLIDNEHVYAFLDIQPLSKGHALVIPKYCGAKLADVPDQYLEKMLPAASAIVKATGAEQYNILQNNGRLAHQMVDHVHVHVIPKPNEEEGLGVGWPLKDADKSELKTYAEELVKKLQGPNL